MRWRGEIGCLGRHCSLVTAIINSALFSPLSVSCRSAASAARAAPARRASPLHQAGREEQRKSPPRPIRPHLKCEPPPPTVAAHLLHSTPLHVVDFNPLTGPRLISPLSLSSSFLPMDVRSFFHPGLTGSRRLFDCRAPRGAGVGEAPQALH